MTQSNDQLRGRTESAGSEGLVRHEERLVASGRSDVREVGQVRLRKRIVAEELTVTIPVRREVVDVVRIEADGTETVIDAAPENREARIEDRTGQDASAGEAAPEDAPVADHDLGVLCYEERPVITTEIYAVERVRLELSHASRTETVAGEVLREEVELVEDTHRR